ncbi:hypothetical protein MTO96_010929 [Rhipicephalus appendiculatus]
MPSRKSKGADSSQVSQGKHSDKSGFDVLSAEDNNGTKKGKKQKNTKGAKNEDDEFEKSTHTTTTTGPSPAPGRRKSTPGAEGAGRRKSMSSTEKVTPSNRRKSMSAIDLPTMDRRKSSVPDGGSKEERSLCVGRATSRYANGTDGTNGTDGPKIYEEQTRAFRHEQSPLQLSGLLVPVLPGASRPQQAVAERGRGEQ